MNYQGKIYQVQRLKSTFLTSVPSNSQIELRIPECGPFLLDRPSELDPNVLDAEIQRTFTIITEKTRSSTDALAAEVTIRIPGGSAETEGLKYETTESTIQALHSDQEVGSQTNSHCITWMTDRP